MGILIRLRQATEAMADAYLGWYRSRYVPVFGDLLTNVKELHVQHMRRNGPTPMYPTTAIIQLYSTTITEPIPAGTPMVCVGHDDDFFVIRLGERDVLLPQRLVVYTRVVSRATHGEDDDA